MTKLRPVRSSSTHWIALAVPPDASGGGLSLVNWAAALAPIGAWPADEPVAPVVERRFVRYAERGPLREHVLFGLRDPVGLLSAHAAATELAELARPLRSARPLREASAAVRRRLGAPPVAYLAELPRLHRALPEGPAALAPIFTGLLDGLTGLDGPVGLSLLVVPGGPLDETSIDDDGKPRPPLPRHVSFALRLFATRPVPATLRARAEALCLATRATPADWRVALRGEDVVAARAAVAELRPLSAQLAPSGSDVAALTLGLPAPAAGATTAIGRPVDGVLPSEGPVLGKVPRPDGRLSAWRLSWAARRGHVLVTGQSGCGKSTALLRMVLDDLAARRSVVLLDPHGELADTVAPVVPRGRLVRIDPRREDSAGLDLLDPDPARATSHLMSAVSEVWPTEFAGPAWQRGTSLGLRSLHATTARPGPTTLADLERFYVDPAFRKRVIDGIRDDRRLVAEATKEHENWQRPRDDASMVNWLASKLTPLTQGPGARLFDTPAELPLEDELASGAVVVVALPLGTLGASTTGLALRMLLTRLTAAITAQGDLAEDERHPISVYVDEAHLATGDALAGLFAQARKFHCAVTVATQMPSQLKTHLQDVLTNAQTHLYGRLSLREAALLEERLGSHGVRTLTRLPKRHLVPSLAEDDPDLPPVVLAPVPLPELPAGEDDDRGLATRSRARVDDDLLEDFEEVLEDVLRGPVGVETEAR